MSVEAYDDGFFPLEFKGRRGRTLLVGVEVNEEGEIKGVGARGVLIDGREVTKSIIGISKLFGGSAILLDGVTYAGFDVADPYAIHEATGKAVVVIQQYPLNIESIRRALLKHFEDGEERLRVIERVNSEMRPLATPWKIIYVSSVGLSAPEAFELVRKWCIYSPVPEPLRIADKLSSIFSRALLAGSRAPLYLP